MPSTLSKPQAITKQIQHPVHENIAWLSVERRKLRKGVEKLAFKLHGWWLEPISSL